MTAAYTYLMDTGTVSIDTDDLLTDVQQEWITAFGLTIDTDASTPQGTQMASETVARTSVMKNNSDLANMLNPNLAYGTFLDAVCAFLGVERGVNLSTVANDVTFTGDPQTNIQAGSRMQTINGDVFSLVYSVSIPSGRSVGATIQSLAYGAVPLPLGELDIIDGTIGWGSAVIDTNATITPGAASLTDPQLKNARIQQLAVQGTASTMAIKAELLNVANVTSCQVVENNTGVVQTVNGVPFTLPNAIWVCVSGTPAESLVAQALYNVHGGGIPFDYGTAGTGHPVESPNGVTALDPATNLPYQMKWTTPILYDAYVHISVKQSSGQSPGANAIANAIMNFANGLEQGEAGFVVSANVSSYEVAGSVCRQYPGVYVKDCKVACVLAGAAAPAYPAGYTTEYIMAMFGQAVLAIGNIVVTLL